MIEIQLYSFGQNNQSMQIVSQKPDNNKIVAYTEKLLQALKKMNDSYNTAAI